jgi:hypothetical protein
MSIFDDKLRPEEVAGGFNPGEPDDDIMLLEKTGKYPGDFPYYQSNQPEIAKSAVASDEIIENVEGNIWDRITEDEIPAETTPEPESEPIFEQIPEMETTSNPEPTPEITQQEESVWQDATIPAFADSDETLKDLGQVVADPIGEAENTYEVSQNEQVESGPISIDDELKNLLEAELKASQKKRKEKEDRKLETQPEQVEVVEVDTEQAKKSFKPVEEKENKVDFIDFDKIDETKKVETEPLIPNVEGAKEVIKSKKTKAPKPPKEKKERKKAGLLFWIGSSVAGILLIAAVSYFAINYYLNNYDKVAKDSTITKEKQLAKKEKSKDKHKETKDGKHSEGEHKPTHEGEHKVDTTSAEFEHKEDTNIAHSDANLDHKEEHLQTDEHSITEHKTTEHKPIEHKVTEKPKPTEKEISHTKVTPKHEPEHKKVKQKSNVTHNKPKVVNKKPEQTTTKPKVAENKIIEQPKTVEIPKVVKPTKAVYTIQVYSTPSFEDAQMWIKKLYSLSISNAYISTQKIRDVVWYRVRFGEYNDKQNAINDARKLGFSQTWVDRIK